MKTFGKIIYSSKSRVLGCLFMCGEFEKRAGQKSSVGHLCTKFFKEKSISFRNVAWCNLKIIKQHWRDPSTL